MSSDNKRDEKEIKENATKESFLSKMKNDKKYNAKVQLIGYGIFIAALVVYLNLSSLSGGSKNNLKLEDFNNSNLTNNNTVVEKKSLLDSLEDNYSYNVTVDVDKKSINTDTNEEVELKSSINYSGKLYDNKLEISKKVNEVNGLYYKLDNVYYNMVNNVTSVVQEKTIYDVIDGDYIELDAILEFISKSSLDHVTDYSSGKKVSVYHYEVNSGVNSQDTNLVEINVIEENNTLTIEMDYSNLFKEMDESILECKLKAVITDIGLVEDFEIKLNDGENTSLE